MYQHISIPLDVKHVYKVNVLSLHFETATTTGVSGEVFQNVNGKRVAQLSSENIHI